MRIIISPAKKMKVDTDSLQCRGRPQFLEQTEQLRRNLQSMSYEELKKLWKCSDSVAALNVKRLDEMNLRCSLTPAILSYEGIQYQYMAPGAFTQAENEYVQEHLRILSGFYGLLRPFDGVVPYRLEMQSKLNVCNAKDLYSFWGDRIAEQLYSETDCIINLASKEYSLSVSRHQKPGTSFLTCVFGKEKDGKVIEKSPFCKMARGKMVRWMAENHVKDPEEIKAFRGLDYRFDSNRSDDKTFVFVRPS